MNTFPGKLQYHNLPYDTFPGNHQASKRQNISAGNFLIIANYVSHLLSKQKLWLININCTSSSKQSATEAVQNRTCSRTDTNNMFNLFDLEELRKVCRPKHLTSIAINELVAISIHPQSLQIYVLLVTAAKTWKIHGSNPMFIPRFELLFTHVTHSFTQLRWVALGLQCCLCQY